MKTSMRTAQDWNHSKAADFSSFSNAVQLVRVVTDASGGTMTISQQRGREEGPRPEDILLL